MRTFSLIAAVLFSCLICAAPSRADGIELFGGYSFVRPSVRYFQTCPLCPVATVDHRTTLQGWEAAAAFKVFGPLALAADFSDTSGSFHGANTHLQTYLVGPQLRFPGPISPFAHLLFGVAHEAIGTGVSGGFTFTGPEQNAFATAIGGGLDLKVLPFISLRPIQIDYILTRFNSEDQHQPRISAGLVLRF